MFFSERFQISSELLKEYGAVDISLVCDIPLFIDPMLIFNSEKEIYKNLHKSIIRYFHFLYTKAEQGLTMKEVSAWFNFSEVPNNWLYAHHQRYAARRGREDRRLYGIGHGSQRPGASRPAGGEPVQGDTVRKGGVSNVKQPQIEATLSVAVHTIAYQD